MPTLTEPQLFAAFREFCQENDFPADIEDTTPDEPNTIEALNILVGSPAKVGAFEVFGLTGNGSYVAFWQAPGTDATQRLICYLSSEGWSWGVCAGSFAEFLTLLPYGIGLISTALFHCSQAHHYPDDPLNVEELSQEFVPMFTAQMQEQYPDLSAYEAWLAQTTGLTIAAQPVARVIEAYYAHPNLEDWLDA